MADVVEWLAERGVAVDRSTVYRWIRRFLPLFRETARAHRQQIGGKWRVDETYCRFNGRWAYLNRAIDQDGQVVDVYFSERRNAGAAERFFKRAIDETGVRPTRVMTDKAKCYPLALRSALPSVEHRCSRYLNNGLVRDHGHLKQRLIPLYRVSSQQLREAHRQCPAAPAPRRRLAATGTDTFVIRNAGPTMRTRREYPTGRLVVR